MTRLMLAVFACFLLAPAASAKAAYMGLKALVATSDVVAVIEVTKTERVGAEPHLKGRIAKGMPKKGYWHYGQQNTFKFVEMVKGGEQVFVFQTEPVHIQGREEVAIERGDAEDPGEFFVLKDPEKRAERVPEIVVLVMGLGVFLAVAGTDSGAEQAG